jgi:hypothetical protein
MAEAFDRAAGAAELSGSAAERACDFVIARARAASGHLFHQGERKPALPCASPSPLVRRVAERRFHRISTAVARALVAWADGFPVELLTSVPSARHVLELQAQGARCVSLLPDGAATDPHPDALAFALHDLCHLDKFIDPAHHLGQVGFFACLSTVANRAGWFRFEADFDEAFRRDWHHVAADMNGSAVFLFAALKMKLKMAVRRRMAVERGVAAKVGGPLTTEEARAFDDRLSELLVMLDFAPDVASAARVTSARRDDPRSALRLLRHFEAVGRCYLSKTYDAGPERPRFD